MIQTGLSVAPPRRANALLSGGLAMMPGDVVERSRRERRAAGVNLQYRPRHCLGTGKIEANEALIGRLPRGCGPTRLDQPIALGAPGDSTDVTGARLLADACADAVGWDRSRLSVRVPVAQILSGMLMGPLGMALERSGLLPERLELELAGSRLIDGGAEVMLALSALRDLGVGLALDGFGTRCASASVLRRLPLTAIKLDPALVCGLPGDLESAALVRATIATGHALRLTVVAGGIETEAQRAVLSGLGCDEGQGALFGNPLSAERLRVKLGVRLGGAGA